MIDRPVSWISIAAAAGMLCAFGSVSASAAPFSVTPAEQFENPDIILAQRGGRGGGGGGFRGGGGGGGRAAASRAAPSRAASRPASTRAASRPTQTRTASRPTRTVSRPTTTRNTPTRTATQTRTTPTRTATQTRTTPTRTATQTRTTPTRTGTQTRTTPTRTASQTKTTPGKGLTPGQKLAAGAVAAGAAGTLATRAALGGARPGVPGKNSPGSKVAGAKKTLPSTRPTNVAFRSKLNAPFKSKFVAQKGFRTQPGVLRPSRVVHNAFYLAGAHGYRVNFRPFWYTFGGALWYRYYYSEVAADGQYYWYWHNCNEEQAREVFEASPPAGRITYVPSETTEETSEAETRVIVTPSTRVAAPGPRVVVAPAEAPPAENEPEAEVLECDPDDDDCGESN